MYTDIASHATIAYVTSLYVTTRSTLVYTCIGVYVCFYDCICIYICIYATDCYIHVCTFLCAPKHDNTKPNNTYRNTLSTQTKYNTATTTKHTKQTQLKTTNHTHTILITLYYHFAAPCPVPRVQDQLAGQAAPPPLLCASAGSVGSDGPYQGNSSS
jgi:hypothetical protein